MSQDIIIQRLRIRPASPQLSSWITRISRRPRKSSTLHRSRLTQVRRSKAPGSFVEGLMRIAQTPSTICTHRKHSIYWSKYKSRGTVWQKRWRKWALALKMQTCRNCWDWKTHVKSTWAQNIIQVALPMFRKSVRARIVNCMFPTEFQRNRAYPLRVKKSGTQLETTQVGLETRSRITRNRTLSPKCKRIS